MRRDLRSLAAAHAVALALSATACGSAPAAVGPKPTPPYTPSGTLLLDLGGFEQRLVRFEFPRGPVKDIIRNSGGGRFFGFRFGAAWGDDGFVYSLVSVNFGLVPDVQLYRTNPGGASREMGASCTGAGGSPSGATSPSRGRARSGAGRST